MFKLARILSLYILMLPSSVLGGTAYTYPGGANPAFLPQLLNGTDSLEVLSGTFAATGNNPYTVYGTASDQSPDTFTWLQVDSGAVLSYAGTNASAITVNPSYPSDPARYTHLNIINNGTISNGTGSSTAIDLSNANVVIWEIDNYGSIIGDVKLGGDGISGASTVFFFGTGTVNGNIIGTSSRNNDNQVWIQTSAPTFSTQGSFTNLYTFVMDPQGTQSININHPVTITSDNSDGFFTRSGSSNYTVNLNANVDCGALTIATNKGTPFSIDGNNVAIISSGQISNASLLEIAVTNSLTTSAPILNVAQLAIDGTLILNSTLSNFFNIQNTGITTISGAISSNQTSHGVASIYNYSGGIFHAKSSISFSVGTNSIWLNNGSGGNGTGTFDGPISFTGATNFIQVDSGQTAFFNNTITGCNTFTNAGSVNIGGAFNFGGFTTVTNTGSLYVIGSGSISGTIPATTSSLNIGKDSTGVANANNFSAAANIIGVPVIHVYNGSFNTNGHNVTGITTSFTVDPSTSATINSTFSGGGAASFTNNGSTTLASGAAISGFSSFANNSSLTIQGAQSIGSANYSGSGPLTFTITSATANNSLTTSGSMNISNAAITINSNFSSVPGNTYNWTFLTAGSAITTNANTTVSIPASSLFNVWTQNPIGTTLSLTLQANALNTNAIPGINQSLSEVLAAMQADITNSGQQQLINAISSATTAAEYNAYLQQLVPNSNATASNIATQNAALNKLESRISMATNEAFNIAGGIAAGDINTNAAMWVSGFGSIANQSLNGSNPGYKADALGTMLGIDYKTVDDNIYGLAFAFSHSNVTEYSNTDFKTHMFGYSLLAYGSNHFLERIFIEWLLTGTTTDNKGSRFVVINNQNMSVTSSYRTTQGGFRVNFNNFFDASECIRIAQVNMLQYVTVYQPPYNENNSVAALHVEPPLHNNILTAGVGARLTWNYQNSWLCGNKVLRTMVSYDLISSPQNSVSSFVVGSNSFTVANPSERVAFKIGADFGFAFYNNFIFQLSYDLELRTKYNDNSGSIKLKYLF